MRGSVPVTPLVLLLVAVLALLTVVGPAGAQPAQDPRAVCRDLVDQSSMSEEGRRAMHELMQSGQAAQMMDRMMDMARRMGNGDVMLGMTRMMEMMSRMGGMMGPGGMMGGQGGMTQPSPPQPKP